MSIDLKGDSKFLTINKKTCWEKGYIDNMVFSSEQEGIRIASGPRYRVQKAVPVKGITGNAEIKDLALAGLGILYILCFDGHLLIYDIGKNFTEMYDEEKGDVVFPGADRLSLKGGVLYIIGTFPEDATKGYIQAIDIKTLETIWRSDSNPVPSDITCDEKGNLYLLCEEQAIVKIDRYGNMAERFEIGYTGGNITRIEAVNEDEVIIYYSKSNTMASVDLRLNKVGDAIVSIDQEREVKGLYSDCSNDIYTLEYMKSAEGGTNNASLTRYYLKNGIYQSEVLLDSAITLFDMDQCGNACALSKDKEMLIIKQEEIMISKGDGMLPRGTYISYPLDSTVYDMKWHRVEVNMSVPEDTQVSVCYLTSNEILNVDGENYLNLPWSEPVINPDDALIEADNGRYLWIRVDLTGTKYFSPTVNEITAYFPRNSYLRYLPVIYQEDAESRDFLEGFLSLFETLLMGTEDQIDNVAALFDPDSAPPEFIKYIADWLSLPVSEYWDEESLRELLKKAAGIYKMRGTREGLRRILEIYLKSRVFIVENLQVRDVKGLIDEQQKEELKGILEDEPYGFHIFVNKVYIKATGKFGVRDISGEDISEVKRILDVEKPAYTKACVTVLEPAMVLNGRTYIGINTCLIEPKQRLDKGDYLIEGSGFVDIADMKIDFENI